MVPLSVVDVGTVDGDADVYYYVLEIKTTSGDQCYSVAKYSPSIKLVTGEAYGIIEYRVTRYAGYGRHGSRVRWIKSKYILNKLLNMENMENKPKIGLVIELPFSAGDDAFVVHGGKLKEVSIERVDIRVKSTGVKVKYKLTDIRTLYDCVYETAEAAALASYESK